MEDFNKNVEFATCKNVVLIMLEALGDCIEREEEDTVIEFLLARYRVAAHELERARERLGDIKEKKK